MSQRQQTYDVGYSHQHQYGGGSVSPRRHVVEPDDPPVDNETKRRRWRLVCTGHPGTREYKGFAFAVTCRDCRNKIGTA